MALENYYSEHEGRTIDRVIREADAHHKNSVVHVTQIDKDRWDGKADANSLSELQTSVTTALTQMDGVVDNLYRDTAAALEMKMDKGYLTILGELSDWGLGLYALLAYTIGVEYPIRGMGASLPISQYMLPLSFLKGEDQFYIEMIDGTPTDNDYFLYGDGVSYATFVSGRYGQWYDFPFGAQYLHLGAPAVEDKKVRIYFRHSKNSQTV